MRIKGIFVRLLAPNLVKDPKIERSITVKMLASRKFAKEMYVLFSFKKAKSLLVYIKQQFFDFLKKSKVY